MDCWICGEPADSKEHKIKASDVRHFFGAVSRQRPIYYQGGKIPNIKVGSAKSKRLKTDNVICARCNDTRTAPYDRAWEQLSAYVSGNWEQMKRRGRFKLQSVSPGETKRQGTYVQLYFAKLFGCRIVDERIPIDITAFVRSVRDGVPHPELCLTFTIATFSSRLTEYAALSEVQAVKRNGVCQRAAWYYTLGEFSVKVTWVATGFPVNLGESWTPQRSSEVIRFQCI